MSNLEIKFSLYENNKIVSTITNTTDAKPVNMLKSLAIFQQDVNAALTKLIEDHGDSAANMDEDDGDKDDEEDEEESHCDAKKMRK